MKTKRQFLKAGIKSGLITGFTAAFYFAFLMTIYFVIARWQIAVVFLLPVFLFVSMPTGLFLGGFSGLIIGSVVYQYQNLGKNLERIAIIFGGVVGGIAPSLVIVLNMYSQSQTYRVNDIFALLIGGILSGTLAGRIGGRRFLHYINSGDEESLEVTIQPE